MGRVVVVGMPLGAGFAFTRCAVDKIDVAIIRVAKTLHCHGDPFCLCRVRLESGFESPDAARCGGSIPIGQASCQSERNVKAK